MDTLILILEIIGTIAFAASGAITAIKKDMDVFGAVILGLTTAVGGGVIRDLVLGITPPKTFQNPLYAMVAVAVSLVVFAIAYFWEIPEGKLPDVALFVMDTLGLASFTVTGMGVAWSLSADYNVLLVIFVGTITGVGGGVLRDVLAGNTPYIFVKHVYACASLLGAVVCVAARIIIPESGAMICAMAVIIVIRCLSAHYRWNLPKVHYGRTED